MCLAHKLFQGTDADFQHTSPGRDAAQVRKVTDYATEFRTLAADSKWNTAP